MKIATSFLFLVFFASCARGTTNTYIGSTPAGMTVRSFLGIPLSDSVDFIRWKLVLQDDQYQLRCNYGISKPNTNGFMEAGMNISLSGSYSKEKNYYRFRSGTKTLTAIRLNEGLFHLLDDNNHLLVGNAGWSYTLCNTIPVLSNEVSLIASPSTIRDSISFEGRSPCQVPGIIAQGSLCYKLKWHIVLYRSGTYKVLGTPWRVQGGRKGNWKTVAGKDGRIVYQLNDEKENGFIYLLKLDENILVFTDATGKLLVGDEDFSYTLNKAD